MKELKTKQYEKKQSANAYPWLRLDNSAKIYPMLVTKKSQNLFRISVDLTETVDVDLLGEALRKTIRRFPGFNVKLVKGFFWYYFESQTVDPVVYPESATVLKKITFNNCNGFSFRVCYFEKRISCEFFHAIADGSGTIEFMKCLLFEYFCLRGYDVQSEQKVLTCATPISSNEIEDSFLAHYKKMDFKDLQISSLQGRPAFQITGLPFEYGKGLINASMDAKSALALAKKNNATLTEYIGGLFMYSIYKTKVMSSTPQDIQLYIPINLRTVFQSKTLRNFTLFSRISADISQPDIPLSSFIDAVKETLQKDRQKESLENKISTTVRAEKLFIMRIMPLPVKHLIFKISSIFFSKKKKTATFTNLGKLSLPESFAPYVDNFSVCMNATVATPVNVSACTTFDKLVISFSRAIADTEIETFFFRYLALQGLDISLISNNWEETTLEV